MSLEPVAPNRSAVHRYLSALYRYAPPEAWVEVRFRLGTGMGQTFHPVAALGAVVDAVLAKTTVTDVFVGVVPRCRRGGSRTDLIGRSRVVWADCDDTVSVAALNAFQPPPSMIVASGTDENRHAYWLLHEAIDLHCVESINRRLAAALGADQRCADAARILRPAGSLSWKCRSPVAVRLVRLAPRSFVSVCELDDALPVVLADVNPFRPSSTRTDTSDCLSLLSPRMYVPRLTGQRVGRSGKIRCPFHDDETPSLHVYDAPRRGWYCFGCGRGGSIYDLAALMWRRGTRGQDFLSLRSDLEKFLSLGDSVHRRSARRTCRSCQ